MNFYIDICANGWLSNLHIDLSNPYYQKNK